jgi:hypothetical protein
VQLAKDWQKITTLLAQKGKILEGAKIQRWPGLSKRLFRQSLNISVLG